jgi:putative DNA primase/helicase
MSASEEIARLFEEYGLKTQAELEEEFGIDRDEESPEIDPGAVPAAPEVAAELPKSQEGIGLAIGDLIEVEINGTLKPCPKIGPVDVLRLILPSQGHLCCAWAPIDTAKTRAKNKMILGNFTHEFSESVERLHADIMRNDVCGRQVYHACASFTSKTNRTQENVAYLKAFWFDADVGPGKPYAIRQDALDALWEFCQKVNAPVPLVIASGSGIQGYWALEEAIDPATWQLYADALSQAFRKDGFKADALSANSACVLRTPGTHHRKAQALDHTAPAIKVTVLGDLEGPYKLEQFSHLLLINNDGPAAKKTANDPPPAWSHPEASKLRFALDWLGNDNFDYDTWLKFGAAIHGLGWGDRGRDIWDEWSKLSPKYDEDKQDKTWKSFDLPYIGRRATVATIYKLAINNGWRPPRINTQPGTAATWEEPVPLPATKPPVEPFSPLFLPEALGPWIEDISDRLQCPPEYPAICAMTAVGSLLAAKVVIRPQANTDWEEAPNLWGVLVGRPGMLKSPAARAALAPLKRLEALAVEQNKADLLAYKQQIKLYKLKETVAEQKFKEEFRKNPLAVQMDIGEEPEEPQPRRHMTNDTTYEKLGEIQIVNTSILVMRDELVSLLMYLDREENSQPRGYFMTGWSGLDGHIFDRIVRGHKQLDRYAISVLGTTQPGRIAEYIKRAHAGGAGDDGFVQRLTQGVWPDEPMAWTDRDIIPNSQALNAALDVFKRIAAATPAAFGAIEEEGRVPYLRFDKDALEDFQVWHKDLNTRMKSGDLAPALESHLAKYKTQVAAYALISHICDVKAGGSVGRAAVRRSIAFCDYLESHARRIYGAVIMAEVVAATEILKHIRKTELKDGFTSRDVHRPRWTGLADIEAVREGLRLLVDHRYLRVEKIQTEGRDRLAYQINPAAFR